MKSVVIAGYARSPFTLAKKGELAKVRPDDLAAQTVRALVERTGVDPADIEDLIVGCAFPEGEQGFNVARLIGFLAELPLSVGGATVNRFCGSSMQAIHMAAGAIQMGAGEVFVCAGVESMTRVPMGGFNPLPNPALFKRYPQAFAGDGRDGGEPGEAVQDLAPAPGGVRARLAAEGRRGAGRRQVRRRDRADRRRKGGTVVARRLRRAPTRRSRAWPSLKLAFDEKGTVTAGTSSPLTDGAVGDAGLLGGVRGDARAQGRWRASRAIAISGCAPEIMGIGPVLSTRKALERAGLELDDIDVIELNEAFAAQSLACIDELGLDLAKVNLDGGAIALGHPLGATGARITGKAAALLAREGKRYAPRHQCIGGGQGIATILEAV